MSVRMSTSEVHRISISFPNNYYRALQRLAVEKRVSIAWVVRAAVRVYVEQDSPLVNEIMAEEDRNHVEWS